MAIDTTPYEFHEHPNTAVGFVVASSLAVLAFGLVLTFPWRAAHESPIRGVSDSCVSPECVSPQQLISVGKARRLKRELANHALLVDIRATEEAPAGLALGSDVQAPFMEAPAATKGAPLEFRMDFGHKVDEALRAAHMRHDDAVILISPSTERSVLAALLLQERGYTKILVVDN